MPTVSTDACVSLDPRRFGNAMVTAAQVANGVGEQAWSVRGIGQSGKFFKQCNPGQLFIVGNN